MFDKTLGFVLRARRAEAPFWAERYVVAILLVLAAILLRLGFLQSLGMSAAFITFYPAVILAALDGGFRAGMLASLLSAAAADYLWLEPAGTFSIAEPRDWVALGVFVASCTLISGVAEKLRQSNERLRWMKRTQRCELEGKIAERTALLRESEERLAAALRAGKLGVYDYNPRTNIIKWDSTVYRLFGVPEGESVTYETFEAGVHPEDIAAVREAVKQSLDPGGNHHYECEYRVISRGDGTMPWVFADGDVTFDADGPCRLVGTVQDITGRKQAEATLRESEERIRIAQQAARIGTFEWNIETGVNTWTLELEALYGLPPGAFGRTQPAFESLVHPEDRAGTIRLVEQAMASGELTTGEWRVQWPDGSIHWLSGRWQVFKDSSGKPLRMTGINLDITDRKQAEEALRQSEMRYRMLHESLRDAFVQVSMDGRIVECNDLYCQLVGYSREEVS
ncbi:MAG TPA: PAS domain-containing protein, partial [Geobacterales bacterium]|nr:PAS domain-containing protein [Geobacterales bacterium]